MVETQSLCLGAGRLQGLIVELPNRSGGQAGMKTCTNKPHSRSKKFAEAKNAKLCSIENTEAEKIQRGSWFRYETPRMSKLVPQLGFRRSKEAKKVRVVKCCAVAVPRQRIGGQGSR